MAITRALNAANTGIRATWMFRPASISLLTQIWPDKLSVVKHEFDVLHPDRREQFITDYLTALITR